MKKLMTVVWMISAAALLTGCADTGDSSSSSKTSSSTAGNASPAPPGAAGMMPGGAGMPPGGAAEMQPGGAGMPPGAPGAALQPGGPAGSIPDPAAYARGVDPATGRPVAGALPNPASPQAGLAPGTTVPPGYAGTPGRMKAGTGTSAYGRAGQTASPPAKITANTNVVEFTAILMNRIQRKIDKKRGRSTRSANPGRRGNGGYGFPGSGAVPGTGSPLGSTAIGVPGSANSPPASPTIDSRKYSRFFRGRTNRTGRGGTENTPKGSRPPRRRRRK